MQFGFLELSDIDLWRIDLLDIHLDLLDTDIPWKFPSIVSSRRLQDMSSKYLQDMSSRRLQDMSSRRLYHMPSRRLQDVFSVRIFRLPRRLQVASKTLCKMFLRRHRKKSLRHLGRRKTVTLKTCWRPTNVCWVVLAQKFRNL